MSNGLIKFSQALKTLKPDIVVILGDRFEILPFATAAMIMKIPIAHIEAGLRTESIFSPFPEEANRRMISQLSSLHFPPTKLALGFLWFRNNIGGDSICLRQADPWCRHRCQHWY